MTGTATFTGHLGRLRHGRHAVVENTAELRDAVTGSVLAETVSSMVVRGEGGFRPSAHPTPWAPPERPADVTLATRRGGTRHCCTG